MNSVIARVLAVVAVLSLTANVLLYLRYSSLRPLVTVGNEVITKKQYQDQLEYQSGQPVLTKLVLTSLVNQAAAKEGAAPTPKDVDDRIQEIHRRSPQTMLPYSFDPAKMAEFRQDLAATLALDNLRIKNVAVTPADVAAYYAKHRAEFALPQQVQTTTVVSQSKVDADTAEDLLRQNQPVDAIGRQPRLHVVGIDGYNPDLEASLSPAFKHMFASFVQQSKVGDVRTFQEGPWFLTFRVNQNSRADSPPLDQIRDQVERAARLAQAPSQQEEMVRLYQAATPTFNYNADKYAAYFTGLQQSHLSKDNGKKTASVP